MSNLLQLDNQPKLTENDNFNISEELENISSSQLKAFLYTNYGIQFHDQEDIIQSALIKAHRNIHKFRHESTFTTWFFIILKNEALNFVNKRKIINSNEVHLHTIDDENEQIETVDENQIYKDTASSIFQAKEDISIYRNLIKQALFNLSPDHKEILHLALEEEKSYQEIADELNIPIGTVMSRLFFARRNAQKYIKEYASRNAIQLNCLDKP